ncbi:MAG: tetratricopeptide repeat protein [Deltaproteobacteria bacterium]|nr:tetratricopeptide repeat protein [Deltaproteobacteria bacterium]
MERKGEKWWIGLLLLGFLAGSGCAGMEGHKRYEAGLKHFQKTKDYGQAVKDLQEAIRLDPRYAPAYNLLGWSQVKQGRMDLACPQFRKALELDSKLLAALSGQSLCLYFQGQDEEAISTARRVSEMAKKTIDDFYFPEYSEEDKQFFLDFYADSQNLIGLASQRQGRFEEAAGHLETALKRPASWSNPLEIRLHLAQSLQAAGKFDPALAAYSRILREDPKSAAALIGRGGALLKLSREEEAEKDFLAAGRDASQKTAAEAGLVEVRKRRTARTQPAWDLLAAREYEKAASAFREALGEHPSWSVLHDGLGWSEYWQGRMVEAENSFLEALRLDPSLPTSLSGREWVGRWRLAPLAEAWALLNGGGIDPAISAFQKILQDESGRLPPQERWRGHDGLGWSLYRKGEYAKAEDSFGEALRLFPQSADSKKGLGFVHFARGRYDLAAEEFGKSLLLNGAQADAQSMIGWIFYRQREFSRAAEAFQKALKIHPSWTDAFAGLGFSHHARGEKEKALAFFRRALWLLPGHLATPEFRALLEGEKNYWPLYAHWGWSYFQNWQFPAAEEQFREALKRFPDRPDLLRGFGYAEYRQKKYDPALSHLEKSWRIDPRLEPVKEYVSILNTPGVHFIESDAQSRLAWCHFFKGDYARAETVFREVIARRPAWANPRSGLAWSLHLRKKYEEAEKEFEQARKADPSYPDSYNGLQAVVQVRADLA